MANEFKVKTGLQIINTQPVTGISDSSLFSATDSSTLATIKAIRGYVDSRLPLGTTHQIPYMGGNSKFNYGQLEYDASIGRLSITTPFISNQQNGIYILDSSGYSIVMNTDGTAGNSFLVAGATTRLGINGKTIFFGTTYSNNDFITITNPSTGYNILNIFSYGNGSPVFKLTDSGQLYCSSIGSGIQSKSLYFNTANGQITYGDVSSGGTPVSYLSQLLDVSLVSLEDNDQLIYDLASTKWKNTPSFWDLSTNNQDVFLYDPSYNLTLSSIELEADAGVATMVNMPINAATSGTEQSYSFKIDASSALRVYGKAAPDGSTLSETAIVVDAQYFCMGDPQTDGTYRFIIDASGNLSIEKRVSGNWIVKVTI
jgi:hypothetical protein